MNLKTVSGKLAIPYINYKINACLFFIYLDLLGGADIFPKDIVDLSVVISSLYVPNHAVIGLLFEIPCLIGSNRWS